MCQRGAAQRQGPRPTGPIGPEALADNLVTLNVRALEAWFNGAIRALAQAGVFAATVTGMVDAPDREPTAQSDGGGPGTRTRKITDTRGTVHAIEGTVYGWQLLVLIEARPRMPLAAKVVPSQAHAGLSMRALVTPARTHLAGHVRLHTVGCDRGCWDGGERWGLAPRGRLVVVPAQANMAVTVDAQAQVAAGEGAPMGRRVHTGRPGQGRTAWTERLAPEGVGIPGLTTDAPDGTPEHGRHHHRRDFQPTPINAVVVRTWNNRDDGPGGNTVVLTNAPVDKPLRPFDDDDRRLIENGCIKAAKQPWSVTHPPQKTARAVHGHALFTVLRFALATASRWPCAHEDTGREPVGWQRWRRQLLEQTRDHVMVFAQDGDGICPMAEYARPLGVNLKDRPPRIGTRLHILAKYGLTVHG